MNYPHHSLTKSETAAPVTPPRKRQYWTNSAKLPEAEINLSPLGCVTAWLLNRLAICSHGCIAAWPACRFAICLAVWLAVLLPHRVAAWLDNAVDAEVGGMHSAWLLVAGVWLLVQWWLLGCLAALLVGWLAGWLDPIASWLLAAGVWLLTPAQNLNIARRFVRLKARGKGLGLRVATRLLGCLTVWPLVRHIDLQNKNN